jgi:serine/threonine-protein kinase
MNRGGTVSVNSTTETTTVAEETVTENNIVTESSGEAEPVTEIQGDSQMPLLIGMNYELKKEQLETDGWLYLEPSYQYSDEYKAGLIIWQSIEAGQPFNSGAVVKVIVSQGSASVQIPDYSGKTLMEYEEELDSLGLSGRYSTEAVVNYSFETGYIIELNRQAGEIFNLSGEETIKIFYASNPETTPATEPPQTTTVILTEPITEPVVIESSTDNSGVQLETAPSIAPEGTEEETEEFSERTEEAPETAPELNETETEIPDYETAPPVPEDDEE